jgi:hypothetical protein
MVVFALFRSDVLAIRRIQLSLMFRVFSRLIRQLRCRRHRWRPDRKRTGGEFCDLCGAKRKAV